MAEELTPPTWRESLTMLGNIDQKLYSYTVEAAGMQTRDLAAVRKAARALMTLQSFVKERIQLDGLAAHGTITDPFVEAVRVRMLFVESVRLRTLVQSPDNAEPTEGFVARIHELERAIAAEAAHHLRQVT